MQGNGANGRGLKALLVGGLLAVTLTMGAGLALVGTVAAATGVAVGGLGVAYGACQHMEADLADDLGVGVAVLRATDPAGVRARLAARGGTLTALRAERAAALADAYDDCRDVFGAIDTDWDVR